MKIIIPFYHNMKGNTQDAPTFLERGVSMGAGDFRLWLLAAGQHVKGNNHKEASRCYENAVEACKNASDSRER